MPPTAIPTATPAVISPRPHIRGALGAQLEARYVNDLIGLNDCAALTGLKPRTVSYYATLGRIPSVKIVHARVYDRAAILQWMEGRPVKTQAARKLKAETAATFTAAQPRIVSPMKGMTLAEAQKWNLTHSYSWTPGVRPHPGYCAPGDDCPLCGEEERRNGFIHYCVLGDGSSHAPI